MRPIRFCPQCGTPIETQITFGAERPTCPNCGYVHFYDPKVAVIAFVTQEDAVLLVKRGVDPEKGKWALPAGYVNYGEDPQAAVIRETLEETGLAIKVTGLLDVMHYVANHAVIVIIYEGMVIGGELCAGDDAVDAAWFTDETLPPDVAFESTRKTLAKWRKTRNFEGLNPPK